VPGAPQPAGWRCRGGNAFAQRDRRQRHPVVRQTAALLAPQHCGQQQAH
jgi:hypothetical protein